MGLTALYISIGVVVSICVIYWLLERIFDITMEDVAAWFIGAVCIFVAVGMVYIFICPKEDLEHAREFVYGITYSDNREEKNQNALYLPIAVLSKNGTTNVYSLNALQIRERSKESEN